MSCKRPHVGVGIIIEKEGKVLLLKRKGDHDPGTWSFPGGKLEFFEDIENCAIRETKEETDLDIFDTKIDRITNDIFEKYQSHYITIYVKAEFKGVPKIMEPDKCSDMKWFFWDNLPKELFLPTKNYINGRI